MYENKFHIEVIILVFMFTVVSLCILFSIYYISPSNYVLYDFEPNVMGTVGLLDPMRNPRFSWHCTLTKEYTIEANKQKKIKYCRYPNKVFRILSNDLDCVPIALENRFKSENIYVNKNKLIKLVNSDLIIKNTTNNTLKLSIEIYSSPGI